VRGHAALGETLTEAPDGSRGPPQENEAEDERTRCLARREGGPNLRAE